MKAKKTKADDDWTPSQEYLAMQLTPEQRAELRAEMQADMERARKEGVYERVAAMRGKIKFTLNPWWGKR
jgi:Spy/CpxP family protein refolding chaperone